MTTRQPLLWLHLRCPDGSDGGFVKFSVRVLFGLWRMGYSIRIVTYAAIKRAAKDQDQ